MTYEQIVEMVRKVFENADGRNIYDKKITKKGFELFQNGC